MPLGPLARAARQPDRQIAVRPCVLQQFLNLQSYKSAPRQYASNLSCCLPIPVSMPSAMLNLEMVSCLARDSLETVFCVSYSRSSGLKVVRCLATVVLYCLKKICSLNAIFNTAQNRNMTLGGAAYELTEIIGTLANGNPLLTSLLRIELKAKWQQNVKWTFGRSAHQYENITAISSVLHCLRCDAFDF